MLASKGSPDGMFVVRPHSSKPNHYALTVMYQMVPYHFEIVSQVCAYIDVCKHVLSMQILVKYLFYSPYLGNYQVCN